MAGKVKLFIGQMAVDFQQHLININAMNQASLLQRLASGRRAAQAVHSHLQKIRRSIPIQIQNIANQRILRYSSHATHPPIFKRYLYYNTPNRQMQYIFNKIRAPQQGIEVFRNIWYTKKTKLTKKEATKKQ